MPTGRRLGSSLFTNLAATSVHPVAGFVTTACQQAPVAAVLAYAIFVFLDVSDKVLRFYNVFDISFGYQGPEPRP